MKSWIVIIFTAVIVFITDPVYSQDSLKILKKYEGLILFGNNRVNIIGYKSIKHHFSPYLGISLKTKSIFSNDNNKFTSFNVAFHFNNFSEDFGLSDIKSKIDYTIHQLSLWISHGGSLFDFKLMGLKNELWVSTQFGLAFINYSNKDVTLFNEFNVQIILDDNFKLNQNIFFYSGLSIEYEISDLVTISYSKQIYLPAYFNSGFGKRYYYFPDLITCSIKITS